MEKNADNALEKIKGMIRNPDMPPLPDEAIDININTNQGKSEYTVSGFINWVFKFIGKFFIILFQKIPKLIGSIITNSPKILNSPIFALGIILLLGYIIIKKSKKIDDSYANFYMIHDSFDSESGQMYKKGAEIAAKENKVNMKFLSSMESSLDKVEYSQTFSKLEKVLESSIIQFNEYMNKFFDNFDSSISTVETVNNIYKGFENAYDEKNKIISEFKEIYTILFEQIGNINNITEVANVNSMHCIFNTKLFGQNVNFQITINPKSKVMNFSEIPDNIDKTLNGTIYDIMDKNQKETHWIDPETFAIGLKNPKVFIGVIYFKIKKIVNKGLVDLFTQLIKSFNEGEKIDAILIELSNSDISSYVKEFVKLNKYKKIPIIMSYGLYVGKPIDLSSNEISSSLLSSPGIDNDSNNVLNQSKNAQTFLHFVGTDIKNVGNLIGDTLVNYFNGTLPALNDSFEKFKEGSAKLAKENVTNSETNDTFNKAKSIMVFIPEMDEVSTDQYLNPIKARVENEWPGSNIIVNDSITLKMQPYEIIGIVSRALQENSYISAVISLDPQHSEYIVATIQKFNPQRISDLPIMVLGMNPYVKVSILKGDVYAAFDFQEENTGHMAISLCAQVVSGKQFYNKINLNTGPGIHITKF
jgi:hypothetical protein